jgi:cell division septation protein DedD
MAGKGDGDRSIGSRHILGLFFGVVLLCCIFFTLGYVMGRDQARVASRGELPGKPASADSNPPPGWSVSTPSSSAAGKSGGETAAIPGGPAAAAPPAKTLPASTPAKAPAEPKRPPGAMGKFEPPLIPRGAIVLQIAALTKDQDALAMASALQERGFPAFVLTPSTDNFYRIQVGPYADVKSADQAKRALESAGFKVIVKR